MKKIMRFAVLSILCSFSFVSQAQESSSLPDGFTNGNIVWIIRTGVSLNNVSGSGVDETKTNWADQKCYGEYKNLFGGNLSFGLYSPLGSSPVYIGTYFSVDMRGFKTSAKWKEGSSYLTSQSTRLTAFNAHVSPLSIGYIAKLSKNTALDLHIGTFFSCDFAGSYKTEMENSDNTKVSASDDISDLEDYNKYDFGLNGGIGLWYNHWGIDLKYQRGISSIFKGGKDYISNNIQLSLGYAF